MALDYAVIATDTTDAHVAAKATISGNLLAAGAVDIASQATVDNIETEGDVTVNAKAETGNIHAEGDVNVKSQATTGDVTAAGDVGIHSRAQTGTIVESALVDVLMVALPSVNAVPDLSADISRSGKDAKDGPLTLSPGSYGVVQSGAKDTILLSSGEYHFESLDIKADSTISANLSGGQPLVIRIAGDMDIAAKSMLVVTGGDASDILILVGGDARLDANTALAGTLVVPDGSATLAAKSTLVGALWAGRVDIKAQAVVTHQLYDHPIE